MSSVHSGAQSGSFPGRGADHEAFVVEQSAFDLALVIGEELDTAVPASGSGEGQATLRTHDVVSGADIPGVLLES